MWQWNTVFLNIKPGPPLQTVLTSSSEQASDINFVTRSFFLASGAMLLLVILLTAYVVYRFGQNKAEGSHEKTLSRKWEIPMIGVPTLLVAIFLYLNITTMNKVQAEVGNRKPDVEITGYQWWWKAAYGDTSIVTANEIHLPVGKRLLLKMSANDVIHDWWIPEFGNKMDMVPGQDNFIWLTIKKPGEYYGICSEFCGHQHAHMRIKVVAQQPNDFNEWLQQHALPAVANNAFSTGRNLFMQHTCNNCHRIKGTEANGEEGPDLTHLASRQTLLAGMLDNNLENLEQWINDPQKIKPGAHMPDFLLPDSSVRAIAQYLYSLK